MKIHIRVHLVITALVLIISTLCVFLYPDYEAKTDPVVAEFVIEQSMKDRVTNTLILSGHYTVRRDCTYLGIHAYDDGNALTLSRYDRLNQGNNFLMSIVGATTSAVVITMSHKCNRFYTIEEPVARIILDEVPVAGAKP